MILIWGTIGGLRYAPQRGLDCFVTVQIVILAMIAAFLGLRLYSVLGRRAEHEEETIDGRLGPKADVTPLAPAPRAPLGPNVRPLDMPPALPAVERGLRTIAQADRKFDAFHFLDGAKAAYGMVLEAFWRGDKAELAELCDADVYDSFAAAIDARTEAGETLDNKLVRIEDAIITGATYDAPMARVTVRFTSDIAAVTRNAEGTVIAGSLNDAITAVDVWTFKRNVNSTAPDWLLDETDEG